MATILRNILLVIILVFLNVEHVFAYEELDWGQPPDSILTQEKCPFDSTANAMIVQKETVYKILDGSSYSLLIIKMKRIKIYNEVGLSHADVIEPFSQYQKIKTIEATCYNLGSAPQKLQKKDIHEETWLKDKQRKIKLKAKAFAVPGVKKGSVIDIIVVFEQETVVFLPSFEYHDVIPIAFTQFRLNLPKYLSYQYYHINSKLIKIEKEDSDKNPVLVTVARNIPAIENESYRPPLYTLTTKMCLKLNKYIGKYQTIEIANTWENLFDYYKIPKEYKKSMKGSKKAKKYVEEIMTAEIDSLKLIKELYRKVRDGWTNINYGSVFKPSDKVDKMMKRESLDPENKATILCSMLRHAGIESDVVWICSSEIGLPKFPSIYMFDYALVYIRSLDLYLDPADPGAKVGIMDNAFYDKLGVNITSKSNELFYTPKTNKISGKMYDLKLRIQDDYTLKGEGSITYYNQSALSARRDIKYLSIDERDEWIEDQVFSEFSESIDSVCLVPDSGQIPGEFTVDFKINIRDFISPDEEFHELRIYPGNSFNKTSIDEYPPRKHSIYIGSKYTNYYKVTWEFGNKFKPLAIEDIKFKEGFSLICSFMTEYNREENRLTVLRQYKYDSPQYPATFAPTMEKLRGLLKEKDMTSIILERK